MKLKHTNFLQIISKKYASLPCRSQKVMLLKFSFYPLLYTGTENDINVISLSFSHPLQITDSLVLDTINWYITFLLQNVIIIELTFNLLYLTLLTLLCTILFSLIVHKIWFQMLNMCNKDISLTGCVIS